MKKFILIVILGLYVCVFAGCHTLDTLSRVGTGQVDLKDTWQAVIADDQEFRDMFW
ncbi:MAG: hypothetical protein ABIA97_04680 [Candidatus Omnitrophota bacterium]